MAMDESLTLAQLYVLQYVKDRNQKCCMPSEWDTDRSSVKREAWVGCHEHGWLEENDSFSQLTQKGQMVLFKYSLSEIR